MSNARVIIVAVAALLWAAIASATTFIVPSDENLIADADAIVTGSIEGSYAREVDHSIETVYQLRLQSVLKGGLRVSEVVDVVSPGGLYGDHGQLVDGSAQFAKGDQVLLFLARRGKAFEPWNLALGKFSFVKAENGERLLVRDLENAGAFDAAGHPHAEKLRLEEGFIRFIHDRIAQRRVDAGTDEDYFVDAASVVLPRPETGRGKVRAEIAPWTSSSYANGAMCPGAEFGCSPGVLTSIRLPGANPSVTFQRSTSSAGLTGAGDGGASFIAGGAALWTNDCGSNITLTNGTTTTAVKSGSDFINTILFNDPSNVLGGGTIGVTTTTFGTPFQSFDGAFWWTIRDSDIVFNNEVNSSPLTSSSVFLLAAMTHEIGHAIGFRHSNGTSANGNAQLSPPSSCDSDNEECEAEATAVMFWEVSGAGFATLQPYDVHAVGAVYSGGSCVVLGTPSGLTATAEIDGSQVAVSWSAATGATGYNVYRKGPGNTAFGVVGTPAGTSFNDATAIAGNAYIYRVTASDGSSESAASNEDFAVLMEYTDPTLTAGLTAVQGAHIDELRDSVDALRALGAFGNASFTTDPVITAGLTGINALHITELRTTVNAARALLGYGSASFPTDSSLVSGGTIKKAHIDELRNSLQ